VGHGIEPTRKLMMLAEAVESHQKSAKQTYTLNPQLMMLAEAVESHQKSAKHTYTLNPQLMMLAEAVESHQKSAKHTILCHFACADVERFGV
jgi:hypothetical protein